MSLSRLRLRTLQLAIATLYSLPDRYDIEFATTLESRRRHGPSKSLGRALSAVLTRPITGSLARKRRWLRDAALPLTYTDREWLRWSWTICRAAIAHASTGPPGPRVPASGSSTRKWPASMPIGSARNASARTRHQNPRYDQRGAGKPAPDLIWPRASLHGCPGLSCRHRWLFRS